MTVPVITNDIQALEYLLGLDAIDAETLETAMARVGRNSGPQIVSSLFHLNRLTPDVLAAGVEAAWTGPESPMSCLTGAEWTSMFETTGYLVGPKRRPDLMPHRPIRLYRGSSVAGAFGWSWTDSVETAQWFADRPHHRGVGRVWTAEVSPHRMFAYFPDSRGEGEYVVDATAMAIEVHS